MEEKDHSSKSIRKVVHIPTTQTTLRRSWVVAVLSGKLPMYVAYPCPIVGSLSEIELSAFGEGSDHLFKGVTCLEDQNFCGLFTLSSLTASAIRWVAQKIENVTTPTQ